MKLIHKPVPGIQGAQKSQIVGDNGKQIICTFNATHKPENLERAERAFCLIEAAEPMKSKDGEFNWLFNFKDGGFNNIWAKTKEEAIGKAVAKYSDSHYCNPDPKSFRKATRESADAQNRAGWMMTM